MNSKLIILLLYVVCIYLTACVNNEIKPIGIDTSQDNNLDTNYTIGGSVDSYSGHGIVTYANGPVRFIDAINGETTVLCDDLGCFHEPLSSSNPNPSCTAQIIGLQTIMLYRGQQVFISSTEDIPYVLEVYTADFYGNNRKKIAHFNDLEIANVHQAIIINNLLAFSYTSNYYFSDTNTADNLVRREKQLTGVALVNLVTDEFLLLPQHESYNAYVSNIYSDENIIYYVLDEQTIQIDFELLTELSMRANIYDEWEPYLKYLHNASACSLYKYNIETNETTLVWYSGGNEIINDLISGYALVSPNGRKNALYMISLDNSERIIISEHDDNNLLSVIVDNNGSFYIATSSTYQNDGESTRQWYNYNVRTLQSAILFEDNKQNIYFRHIFPEIIYISGYDESDKYFLGSMEREDFLRGDFDSYNILIYPNEEWVY